MVYLQRPQPLIAPRIEFVRKPPPSLPSIKLRIEFTLERLAAQAQSDNGGPSAVIDLEMEPDLSGARAESSTPQFVQQRASLKNIPKPSGEPGRPFSGGYCLTSVLVGTHKWSEQSVEDLTAAVRAEAREKLNMQVNFRSQNSEAIQQICDNVCLSTHQTWG